MAVLHTNHGDAILIDDDLYQELSKYRWWKKTNGYAATRFKKGHSREGQRELLHRLVMQLDGHIYQPGFVTDHINGNKLDCRRDNLRIVTIQQNLLNSKVYKNKTSKYRGVSWYSRDNCWRVVTTFRGKWKHVGYFKIEEEAAQAYRNTAESQPMRRPFINPKYWVVQT